MNVIQFIDENIRRRSYIGNRYGRLTVISEWVAGANRRQRTWVLVRCDCGAEKNIRVNDMTSGRTKSCGCLQREKVQRIGSRNRTHGETLKRTPEYRAWVAMKHRCTNPRNPAWDNYG